VRRGYDGAVSWFRSVLMQHRGKAVLGVLSCAAIIAGVAFSDGGLSRAGVVRFSGTVADVAATITGQPALLADAATTGRHAGFDTGTYPGDAAMRAWRTSGAPYEWTGYYLPAPCHPDTGWAGKRETLTSMGYGLAVIYVGQQTWGRTPGKAHMIPVTVSKKVRTRVGRGAKRRWVTRTVAHTVLRKAPPPPKDATCNADFVGKAHGATEAMDAIARTEREGFPRGTTVFLDVEYMDVTPPAMRDYYSAWVRTMLADGRYRPGIYVHTNNANVVYTDVKQEYLAAGLADEPPFWIAKSRGFDIHKLPSEMGHAFAAVWQGVLDVEQTWAGHKIPIDVNVAGSPSPSAATLASYVNAALGGRITD
jgi:hypothetical protein